MTHSFPGGVTDLRGERGFIQTAPDEVAALELATGEICWRQTGIGQPIAATASKLLTLDRDEDKFQLRIIDARSGAQTATVPLPMMPRWAREALGDSDALQIEAVETGRRLKLIWHLRLLYRGGARPGVASESQPEASGAFVVDLDSATVRLDDPAPARAAHQAADVADLGPHAEPADDVLEIKRMGDRLYSLKVERLAPNETQLKLQAKDARSGTVQWETDLSRIEAALPAPQRE